MGETLTVKKKYLAFLKKSLIDYFNVDKIQYKQLNFSENTWKIKLLKLFNYLLNTKNYAICKIEYVDKERRENGFDWPANADTMIGLKRLDNLEYCLEQVVLNNVEGDLIETGVWRGGSTIFMKAFLDINHEKGRKVWVADSFEGLPKPNVKYDADKDDTHYKYSELAISLDTVKNNFTKYDLLDENVVFLKGWFKDTLPKAPINKLSILRLDGDMYESTMDALENLYPKLSNGGYVIIDDYGAVKGCRLAVTDFRKKNNISESIQKIDWAGVYWKKENATNT